MGGTCHPGSRPWAKFAPCRWHCQHAIGEGEDSLCPFNTRELQRRKHHDTHNILRGRVRWRWYAWSFIGHSTDDSTKWYCLSCGCSRDRRNGPENNNMTPRNCEAAIRRLLAACWHWAAGEIELAELQDLIRGARKIKSDYTAPHSLVDGLYAFPRALLDEIEKCVARGKRSLRAKLPYLTPIRPFQNRKGTQSKEERERERDRLNNLLRDGSRRIKPRGWVSGQTRKPGSHRSGKHSS